MNTPLTRERLRRMAFEIEVGTGMAEKSLPALIPSENLFGYGAFSGEMASVLKPDPRRAALEAIEAARKDAEFLKKLVKWMEATSCSS